MDVCIVMKKGKIFNTVGVQSIGLNFFSIIKSFNESSNFFRA